MAIAFVFTNEQTEEQWYKVMIAQPLSRGAEI